MAVDNAVDFISLLKDISGNQFDPVTGLPLNGKWFDIKGWHTDVDADAIQVALDVISTAADVVSSDTNATNASTSAATATTKAGEASTSATGASASETAAGNSQASCTTSATTATTKAAESTSSAVLSADSATSSATSASASSSSASASSTSASNAATSATNASTSEGNASTSETNALTYSNTASNSATSAGNSASAASTDAGVAATKVTEATTQAGFSNDWAVEAEDVQVNDGVNPAGFSAFHWAQKAVAAVGGVTQISDLSDVPALAGSANRYLRVNSLEDAIEFDTLTKSDVGLDQVDNTSDLAKAISSLTQTELDTKASQASLDGTNSNVNTLQNDTAGITNQAAAGSDPLRVQVDKSVYTQATQVLATIQDAELTSFGLLNLALVAETIGTY